MSKLLMSLLLKAEALPFTPSRAKYAAPKGALLLSMAEAYGFDNPEVNDFVEF